MITIIMKHKVTAKINSHYLLWYPSVVQYNSHFKAQIPNHSSVLYAFNGLVVCRTQNARLNFFTRLHWCTCRCTITDIYMFETLLEDVFTLCILFL